MVVIARRFVLFVLLVPARTLETLLIGNAGNIWTAYVSLALASRAVGRMVGMQQDLRRPRHFPANTVDHRAKPSAA